MMKYKVIKTYPNSPFLGDILVFPDGETFAKSSNGKTILLSECEENPEFFAPHLFTIHDGLDIYAGDLCHKVITNTIVCLMLIFLIYVMKNLVHLFI